MSATETLKKFAVEYPKKMIQLLKNQKEIEERLIKPYPDEDWYFSPEGKQAYEKLSSLGQKTRFFWDYLLSVALISDSQEILYRVAFVMANSMVDSALEFGGYPNVLDEAKNPLVRYIKNRMLLSGDEYLDDYCGDLLCVLHNGTYEQKAMYRYNARAFERLSYCKAGEPLTDIYKIERDIISAFSLRNESFYDEYDEDDDEYDEDDEEYDDNDEVIPEKLSFFPYLYSRSSASDDNESVGDIDDEE